MRDVNLYKLVDGTGPIKTDSSGTDALGNGGYVTVSEKGIYKIDISLESK